MQAGRIGIIAAMTRRLSLIFGLLIGVMWMGGVIFGNLGDTTVLGNIRTFHFNTYRVVGWAFIGGALTLTAGAGFFGCGVATGTSDRVELYLAKAAERKARRTREWMGHAVRGCSANQVQMGRRVLATGS